MRKFRCVEAITYFILYNLHDCNFNKKAIQQKGKEMKTTNTTDI